MTKTEIIAEIAATTGIKTALTPRLNETVENIRWYEVPVLETDEAKSLGWKRNIYFYTIDEGGAGEAAYYYKDSPRQELPVSDTQMTNIDAYIIAQANVIGYTITEYNPAGKWVTAKVFSITSASAAKLETWIVYKPVGAMTHRVIA